MSTQANQSTTSQNKYEQDTMSVFYMMLLGKHPAQSGETRATYMERLLQKREGADENSVLYVETEILMLFQLLSTLRSQMQTSPDDASLRDGYQHNKPRLEALIDKWCTITMG